MPPFFSLRQAAARQLMYPRQAPPKATSLLIFTSKKEFPAPEYYLIQDFQKIKNLFGFKSALFGINKSTKILDFIDQDQDQNFRNFHAITGLFPTLLKKITEHCGHKNSKNLSHKTQLYNALSAIRNLSQKDLLLILVDICIEFHFDISIKELNQTAYILKASPEKPILTNLIDILVPICGSGKFIAPNNDQASPKQRGEEMAKEILGEQASFVHLDVKDAAWVLTYMNAILEKTTRNGDKNARKADEFIAVHLGKATTPEEAPLEFYADYPQINRLLPLQELDPRDNMIKELAAILKTQRKYTGDIINKFKPQNNDLNQNKSR